jgi:integrase
MPSVRLKGIKKVKSKGHIYYYAWIGGPRLDGSPGSPDFVASYLRAVGNRSAPRSGTINAVIAKYRISGEFTELAPSTQKAWLPWIDRVQAHWGKLNIKQFENPSIRQDIKEWRDNWRKTPRSADYAKQVLSRILGFAVEGGMLSINPCGDVANIYVSDRSDIIWTAADIDALLAKASPEIAYAARLAALTGIRQGDILTLTWDQISDLAIERTTGKSRGRRRILVPVIPDLRTLLAEIPRRGKTVLTNSRGQPWRGFGSSWTKAMNDTWPDGRPEHDLHFHDLRGTAATNFYRANFTIREIAEILGWKEERVERLIDRYIKRDEILRDRIRRFSEANT